MSAVGLLAAAAIAAMVLWSGGAGAQNDELQALAGDGESGYSVNLFLPENITVNTGDTVRWSFPWYEPHTLTYGFEGNPAAPSHPGQDPVPFDGSGFYSSGFILGGQDTAALTFEAPGEYEFWCLIHPFMVSTVTVVDEGEGEADTQAEMDAATTAAYESALADLKAIAADLAGAQVGIEQKADGTRRYTVVVSAATMEGDVMQYFPATLNIKEGDSILFRNETPVPHTATFGDLPEGVFFLDIEDPAIMFPVTPGDAYEGEGYWNTGIIGVDWPTGLEFEMTFGKAGTYEYYCVLHELQDMVATVVVSEADDDDTPAPTPTPAPPATGTGSIADGGATSLSLALGALALAAAAGGAAIRARR